MCTIANTECGKFFINAPVDMGIFQKMINGRIPLVNVMTCIGFYMWLILKRQKVEENNTVDFAFSFSLAYSENNFKIVSIQCGRF